MSWSRVPPEVFESILLYLDLQSLQNLRLVNTSFSIRCIGPRFQSFFKNVKTDLTKSSLECLSAKASHPTVKHWAKHLTIVATIYDQCEVKEALANSQSRLEIEDTEEILREISSIQTKLLELHEQETSRDALPDEFIINHLVLALKGFKSLSSIKLDAFVIDGSGKTLPTTKGPWQSVWKRASHVHYLAMSAILESDAAIESLDVFSQAPRCSIPSADITALLSKFDPNDFKTIGASLKSIALSISTRVETELQKTVSFPYYRPPGFHGLLDASDPPALSHDNYPGVARFLQNSPNLSTLYLHLYRTVTGNIQAYDQLFTTITLTANLPKLEVCSLSGLYVTDKAMLKFLQDSSLLRHLELDEIELTSGLWEPIFNYLSGMSALAYLRLSSLRREKRIVNLQPVWGDWPLSSVAFAQRALPVKGPMVHTSEFNAEDLERGLTFLPTPHSRLIGSTQLTRWRRRRRREYGTP
ncbi:hypothetical protein P175DRAFT_0439959 [Aspergillus ochraceoroseus IBT 24754]|uniref:F-box domain-containing protein n=1 Tax=Aspergillus ochraceoroseus IBT 24754 TaxID=1392256 RepID=A0A2T5LVD3_9EURO|nr:uncharacterized protein P175DRAFT_0439959 [Aspergillus ochraceoroseus IBT 24754]PTU20246.1 hypothetical protein P175DRAFT_0439959 [Aspergillus ochraceoroseus IBT 24754]